MNPCEVTYARLQITFYVGTVIDVARDILSVTDVYRHDFFQPFVSSAKQHMDVSW